MKIKKILTILIIFEISLITGCGSTQNIEHDEYTDNETASVIKSPDKTVNSSKSSFWDSFWGKDKYTEFGDFTINTTNALFSLENKEAVIVAQNKENTIGFGSGYLAAYYYVTYNDENRKQLISDINRYLSDFENKKLDRNDSKSFKTYGSLKTRLDWGAFKSSTPNYGFGVSYIGYKFKGKSPYFTITIYSTANQKFVNGDDSVVSESINLSYYLTKAQARTLADMLSDEYVEEKLKEKTIPEINSDGDEY